MRLSEAAQQVSAIRWEADYIRNGFKLMASSITRAEKIFENYPEFSVMYDEEKGCIDVSHFDTKICFQLFLALDAGGNAIGRVVCLHHYSLLETDSFVSLGAFQFDRSKRTSLGNDEYGYPIQMGTHADVIVAHYLQQAHLANGAIGS